MPGDVEAKSDGAHELTLSVELSAFVLIVLYVAIAALNQSDAELVLPFSKFDLGIVLEQFKEGIPGGAFVAPILKIQVPLSIFYVFAPIVILLLHAYVVWRRDPLDAAPTLLRLLAIWSPPVTIAIMRWRFTPFVFSRPTPPIVGEGILLLHAVALILDGAVVAVARATKVVFPVLPRAGTAVLSGQLSNFFYGELVAFAAFLLTYLLGFQSISDRSTKTGFWSLWTLVFVGYFFFFTILISVVSPTVDRFLPFSKNAVREQGGFEYCPVFFSPSPCFSRFLHLRTEPTSPGESCGAGP